LSRAGIRPPIGRSRPSETVTGRSPVDRNWPTRDGPVSDPRTKFRTFASQISCVWMRVIRPFATSDTLRQQRELSRHRVVDRDRQTVRRRPTPLPRGRPRQDRQWPSQLRRRRSSALGLRLVRAAQISCLKTAVTAMHRSRSLKWIVASLRTRQFDSPSARFNGR